jgi:hypothetical protein
MYVTDVAPAFFSRISNSKSIIALWIRHFPTLKMKPLLLLYPVLAVNGFVYTARTIAPTTLSALTERQMQFWEDVEEGLNDIEKFFAKSGQSINRIRDFGRYARGELPKPTGISSEHEPSEEYIAGLTATPFWEATEEPDLFPWARELEANSHIIQKEFESKLLNSNKFTSDSAWQNQVMGDGWSAIRLQRLGIWNTENCKEFPQSYELLRSLQIPLAVRGVCFARQAPGSGVQPHSDGRNFILTSHLGLKIPTECWIQVGAERRGWKEGKLTTLDTSFIHATNNDSDSDRHVLIIDYWHPELSEAERSALDFVYDLRNKFDSGEVRARKPRSLQVEGEGGLGAWFDKMMSGER